MVKTVWRGFPQIKTSLKECIDRIEDEYNAKSIYPSTAFSVFHFPKGELMGVKFQLHDYSHCCIDMKGKVVDFELNKQIVNFMITNLIGSLDLDIESEREKYSYVIFWFILGGGKTLNDLQFGADYRNHFLLLLLVVLNGEILSLDKWIDCASNKPEILNIQDNVKVMMHIKDNGTRQKIINFMSKDSLAPKGVSKEAYGCLLIPESVFLKKDPLCWVLIKSDQNG